MLTIVFALSHDLSSSFQGSLIFVFFECLVIVDDTLDESLLKICRSVLSVKAGLSPGSSAYHHE